MPQEKPAALCQRVRQIWTNKPQGTIKLAIRLIPVGNLSATQECKTSIQGIPLPQGLPKSDDFQQTEY